MEKYICTICNKEDDDRIIPYHKRVENQILNVIKKSIPRWNDNDEIDRKAVDYYRVLIQNKTIK